MPRFATTLTLIATLLTGAAHAAQVSYRFTGNCVDCAAAAGSETFPVDAWLVLQDPVPGAVAGAAQFFSFSYGGSNLVAPFSVTLAGGGGDLVFDPLNEDHGFHADFTAALPGFADVDLVVTQGDAFAFFNSAADGSWTLFRTDAVVGDDFGDVGTWNGVPLPGTLALAALPLATLLRRRPATARAALPRA